jgi:hypothetical protein
LSFIRLPLFVVGGNLMNKGDIKPLILAGIVWTVIQSLISCGIFITFKDMAAYAAPKDSIAVIENQLNRIEEKVDKLILMRK